MGAAHFVPSCGIDAPGRPKPETERSAARAADGQQPTGVETNIAAEEPRWIRHGKGLRFNSSCTQTTWAKA
jgi:hypothetical protein